MTESSIPCHHVRQELCTTRPSYRDGRKLTAVKVYTVHQESRYLLVQNVPAVGARDQIAKLFSAYGTITDLHPLDDYPAEKFTEVYLIKYQRIQSARFAKKKLDDHSFFGGSLHISYAPEYETVQETREKLQDRRKVIAAKVRQLEKDSNQTGHFKASSRPVSTQIDNQLSLQAPQERLALPPPPPPQQRLPPPPPPPLPTSSSVASQLLPESSAATPHFQNSQFPEASAGSVGGHGVPPQGPERHNTESFQGDGSGFGSAQGLEGFDFSIPPPPIPGVSFDGRQYRTPHFSRKNYEFARVPSANATFPPGYDPRLLKESSGNSGEGTESSQTVSEERRTGSRQSVSTVTAALASHQHTAGKSKEQSSQSSRTVAIKGGEKIVIKQYKPKGRPPRFVPRQVKEKPHTNPAQTNSSANHTALKTEEREVNHEIRREAFRLGEEQGPLLPSDPETREQLLGQRPLVEPKVEASVIASVKAIRKRLSKCISETVSKKMKAVPAGDNSETLPGNVETVLMADTAGTVLKKPTTEETEES